MTDEMMSVDEISVNLDKVMEKTGLSKRTLYTYIKRGRLPAFKVGKEWRVKIEDLKRFIETGSAR